MFASIVRTKEFVTFFTLLLLLMLAVDFRLPFAKRRIKKNQLANRSDLFLRPTLYRKNQEMIEKKNDTDQKMIKFHRVLWPELFCTVNHRVLLMGSQFYGRISEHEQISKDGQREKLREGEKDKQKTLSDLCTETK